MGALALAVFRDSHRGKRPMAASVPVLLRQTPRLPPATKGDSPPEQACLVPASALSGTLRPDPLGLAGSLGEPPPSPLPCPRLLLTAHWGFLLLKGLRGRLRPTQVRHRLPATESLETSLLQGLLGWGQPAFRVSASALSGTPRGGFSELPDRKVLLRASSLWTTLSPPRKLRLRLLPKLLPKQARHLATSSETLCTVPDPSLT